jgi:gliding motility-associated lipoprotein GldD
MKNLILFLFIASMLSACQEQGTPIPKPIGYPRIDFPDHAYKDYSGSCPFSFRVPQYATVVPDTARGAEPCWFSIYFPKFNARIHMSYKRVASLSNLHDLTEDARTFAYKHTVKAEDIYDSMFYIPSHHVNGITYEIAGNTASSLQFFATDSNAHFLRGALYFFTHPNKDSLSPVIRFIRTDMDTLVRSLRWK